MPPPHRPPSPRAWSLALGFALLAAVGLFEGGLRLGLVPMPTHVARYLDSCYEPTDPARYLYVALPRIGLGLHRPDVQLRCAFNGHAWSHRSDAYGFRNPTTLERADVVLLGDSMVYGHGVEERDGVVALLGERTGLAVANLAITGGSPVHQVGYFRNFVLPLRPRVIVAHLFRNDLADIRAQRDPDQIRAFLRGEEVPELRVPGRAQLLADAREGIVAPSLAERSRAFVALRYAATHRADGSGAPARPRAAPGPERGVRCDAWRERWSLEARYLKRAVELMAGWSRDADARLVLVYLPSPEGRVEDRCLARLVERFAERVGVESLRPPLTDARGLPLPGTRLENDGHLTRKGHAILADALVPYLDEPSPHRRRARDPG